MSTWALYIAIARCHGYYYIQPRAYRAAVGGERACNPHSANVDGEILIVTKYRLPVQHVTSSILAFVLKYTEKGYGHWLARSRARRGRPSSRDCQCAKNGETGKEESIWFCWHVIEAKKGFWLVPHRRSYTDPTQIPSDTAEKFSTFGDGT